MYNLLLKVQISLFLQSYDNCNKHQCLHRGTRASDPALTLHSITPFLALVRLFTSVSALCCNEARSARCTDMCALTETRAFRRGKPARALLLFLLIPVAIETISPGTEETPPYTWQTSR